MPLVASASWYWPFGGGRDADAKPRVSELMEPASVLIDNASDYAQDGKVDEAVAEYRKALAELDRVEIENPDRVDTAEFATLRNKRAIVNSAIDSLLLEQARKNAKSVVITDTSGLEKEYAVRKAMEKNAKSGRPGKPSDDSTRLVDSQSQEKTNPSESAKHSRKERLRSAIAALNTGDEMGAMTMTRMLLEEKPNDAAALNLKARIEMHRGDLAAAETTLGQCIASNPRSYYAYYNMARVLLRSRPGEDGRASAVKYYDMGREIGGPKVEDLEKLH